MNTKTYLFICMTGALISLSSCSDNDSPNSLTVEGTGPQPLVKINLTAEQQGFVGNTNEFAFSLARAVDATTVGDNMNVSPVSVAYVLGMLLNGADGDTRAQIADALGFGQTDVKTVNEYFRTLLEGAAEVDKTTEIYIANAIIANRGFNIKPTFSETVASYYDARTETCDFATEDVAGKVNNWAREKSEGNIPEIIDKVSDDALMYALNAVYFMGSWETVFDSSLTLEETFTTEDGKSLNIKMMHDVRPVYYAADEMYSIVRLPYGNSGWSMEVLLPAKGKSVDDVLNTLDAASWNKAMASLSLYYVDIALPRFDFNSSLQLEAPLRSMGITDAFDNILARFSNLSDQATFVSKFIQKTQISVNESGTEAAAVTVAEMSDAMALPLDDATFHADRPFVFVITENTTGTIYFIGTKKR